MFSTYNVHHVHCRIAEAEDAVSTAVMQHILWSLHKISLNMQINS